MKSFVYGKNALLMAKKEDGNYYPFACVEEISLRVTAGLLETTTIGSGQWQEFFYSKKKNWEGSLKGVVTLEDATKNCWTQPQIYAALNGFKNLDIKFFLIDTKNRMVMYTGTVLATELGVTGSPGEGGAGVARWDIKLQGSGALVQGAVADKKGYLLNEQSGKQLLEPGNGGAILQG